jgi:hypothetical protein
MSEVPERLQQILKLISDYHEDILHNTLDTQRPQYINDIRKFFKERNTELINFVKWRQNPKSSDEKFIALINKIRDLIEPWDSDITTLVPEWCNKVFIEYPFTLSTVHIRNLYKNSQERIDAVSSESDTA